MGHAQVEKKHFTVEEYFAWEETSEIRHEFYKGEILAMAGTTLNHNRIVRTIDKMLDNIFRPRGCETFTESVKLEAIKNTYYPYPDVMVTCHKLDLQSKYTIANPVILVEVLSDSTAAHDRNFKLKKYKKIPSLQHYLLVSQYECSVELYSRIEQSEVWTYQLFEEMTDKIRFPDLDFTIRLGEIYENITFVSPEEEL